MKLPAAIYNTVYYTHAYTCIMYHTYQFIPLVRDIKELQVSSSYQI